MLNNLHFTGVNHFEYDGKSSLDFGILIKKADRPYGTPCPDVDIVNIPGRGDVILSKKVDILDNESYADINKVYEAHIIADKNLNLTTECIARHIHTWLYSNINYKILTDSYEPDYYRLAYVTEQMAINDIVRKILGGFTITFTAKAIKYAVSGKNVIELPKPGNVYNPEGLTAKPIIRAYGSGDVSLVINDRQYDFTITDNYIDIDSESMCSYKEDVLMNDKTKFKSYPKLISGRNEIAWTGEIIKLEIIPRWCSL